MIHVILFVDVVPLIFGFLVRSCWYDLLMNKMMNLTCMEFGVGYTMVKSQNFVGLIVLVDIQPN